MSAKIVKKIALGVIGLTLVTSTTAFAVREQAPLDPYRVIVKYKKDPKKASISAAHQAANVGNQAGFKVARHRSMANGAEVISFSKDQVNSMSLEKNVMPEELLEKALEKLRQDPNVLYAERDAIVTMNYSHKNQWDEMEAPGGVEVEGDNGAWNITLGSPDINVAVVDTGIASNKDLANNILPGFSFVYNDNNPTDEGNGTYYHGTHVAGTIVANGRIKGIAPFSKVVPVQVLGENGSGYTSDVIDGVYWAAGFDVPGIPRNMNPANVINLSLGSTRECGYAWQEAISTVTSSGVPIVVAAGNEDNNVAFSSPANCQGVISIAATNRHGHRSYYSNYGRKVTLAAPGGEIRWLSSRGILSTVKDGYSYMQGTSMAAPHAAGVIALMLSVNPYLTPEQIKEIITTTATPFPGDKEGYSCLSPFSCGAGIIHAPSAVSKSQALLN